MMVCDPSSDRKISSCLLFSRVTLTTFFLTFFDALVTVLISISIFRLSLNEVILAEIIRNKKNRVDLALRNLPGREIMPVDLVYGQIMSSIYLLMKLAMAQSESITLFAIRQLLYRASGREQRG